MVIIPVLGIEGSLWIWDQLRRKVHCESEATLGYLVRPVSKRGERDRKKQRKEEREGEKEERRGERRLIRKHKNNMKNNI